MDSITVLKPSSRFSSIFNLSIPRTEFLNSNPFSVFKFDRFRKFRSSPISVSYRIPWNPKTQTDKCNYRLPINPIWVFVVPLIRSIRDVAASGTRMGIFLLRNTVEKWSSSSRELDESYRVLDGEKMGFLQNGGIGMTLLSVTSTAKVRISPFMATLAANPTFVSAMLAWMTAQSLKMFLNFFVERKWDFRILCSSGGMPSSHAALCTALTTSVALCHGVADSLFPVCLGFSLIVMYDAIGVRRHAGMHAELLTTLAFSLLPGILTCLSLVLNMIVQDLFQGHPISQRKLKELLGHTPSQVFAGALLGIMIACFCCQGRLAPM